MTCLPSCSVAKRSATAAVSSLVSKEVTSSTSGSTGTGLKKWIPMTWLGRFVAMASFMIGIDEVFEARTASGSSTTLSRDWKTDTFSGSDSTTASMTSCRSPSEPISAENSMRASAAAACAPVSLPPCSARAIEALTRARPISRVARSRSTTLTSRPARAAASAMPEPMRPQPTMPTLWISTVSFSCSWRRGEVRAEEEVEHPSPSEGKHRSGGVVSPAEWSVALGPDDPL
jgi:hypothetical protein